MSTRTNPAAAGVPADKAPAPRKPRLALFVATAAGLGYLKPAPGTWGSLAGVALFFSVLAPYFSDATSNSWLSLPQWLSEALSLAWELLIVVVIGIIGVKAADRAASYLAEADPPRVVIDEVSGMMLTLLLGIGVATPRSVVHTLDGIPVPLWAGALNWKYLLLGFILFRAFDIWKPFPVRQAEKLPGGWGIMADDWVAAIYAALGLWIARALGL